MGKEGMGELSIHSISALQDLGILVCYQVKGRDWDIPLVYFQNIISGFLWVREDSEFNRKNVEGNYGDVLGESICDS